MIPLYHILVHIPSAVNDTIKVGESELYLDTKFNEFQHRTMKAKVVGIPAKFKSELEIGDYVFHHHHVALNDTQVVDPKEKIEKSFIEIITLKEPEKRWGRIVYGSQWLEEEGLAVGDVVYFAKDADYEMDINGRKLWRMQIHHLICQKL